MKQEGITVKAHWLDRTLITSFHGIALCFSENDFRYECKRLNIPIANIPEWLHKEAGAVTHELISSDGKLAVIVCIRLRNKNYLEYCIHEAVHIWRMEMECIGEEKPSREFEAYGISRLSMNLITEYEKLNKGKRK